MTLRRLDRYDAAAVSPGSGRAVVVGGSVAGLCAARVLADRFEEVVVLDRDPFPETPTVRDGAPQTAQPHLLLEAGRAVLERLFPGFGADVRAAGGLDLGLDEPFVWHDRGVAITDADVDLDITDLYASRALFEAVLRDRVRATDGVSLRGDRHFIDYRHDPVTETVTGVRFRDVDGTETGLDAALVVDATGRASRTPRWLEANGYPTPAVDAVTVDLTYSTVRISRPSDRYDRVLVTAEPDRPRGAAMLPVEGDRWEVVLQGLHGERAPADPDRFRRWAASLPVDTIARQLRERRWLTDPDRFPFPRSVRRHYEGLDRFPDGLLVTGDAVASFNPVYGQGMSVAALDALALHHELAGDGPVRAARFFDRVSDVVDQVWLIAVGNDFTFDRTTGPKPYGPGTDVFNRYMTRLIRRARIDERLFEAFMRVFRLERPVASLLRPGVVWRVLRPRRDVTPPAADHARSIAQRDAD